MPRTPFTRQDLLPGYTVEPVQIDRLHDDMTVVRFRALRGKVQIGLARPTEEDAIIACLWDAAMRNQSTGKRDPLSCPHCGGHLDPTKL